jgi:hypothetical protein
LNGGLCYGYCVTLLLRQVNSLTYTQRIDWKLRDRTQKTAGLRYTGRAQEGISMIKQWLSRFFGEDYTLSKRQLGALILVGGVLVLAAAGVAEVVRDQPSGFGTMQKLAVLAGVVGIVLGATLWPLGDRPA